MLDYLLKLFIIILLSFCVTSCKLVSHPGYSDDFLERLGQVHEDEQNPAGKERRKLLYIHRNDTYLDLEDFYHKKVDTDIIPTTFFN